MISNRLLFKETFKKYIWAITLSFIVFFLFIFLPPIMMISGMEIKDVAGDDYLLNNLKYFFSNGSFNHLIPILFFAVLMGNNVFSYLHNKKQVDFYHSLPIKRGKIFFLNYSLGILSVIPVYIIVSLLTAITFSSIGLGVVVDYVDVFKSIIWSTTFFLVIYSIFNLSTILTGSKAGRFLGIFFLVFQILIKGIGILIFNEYFSHIELGIDSSYAIPIIAIFSMGDNLNYYGGLSYRLSDTQIIISYIIAAIVLCGINYLLFLKRKSEKAGTCIAFDKIKTPLKYLGVVIGTFYIGFIFYRLTSSLFWQVFGIIIGGTLLHFITEIIYESDFKAIFKNWYHIFGCIIISVILTVPVHYDIFNLANYVPKAENVKEVDFGSWEYYEPLKDTEVIEKIIELNKIANEDAYNKDLYNENLDFTTYRVGYKLKNGIVIYKYLRIYFSNENIKLLEEIQNSEEYVLKKNRVLKINEDEIEEIIITNNAGKKFHISKYAKELLNALQEDIKNNVGKERGNILYKIELGYSKDEYDYSIFDEYIYDSYINTLNLMQEKTNFEDEELKLENIESLYLCIGSNSFTINNEDEIQYVLERSKPREKEIYSNDFIVFTVYYNNGNASTTRVVLEGYENDIINHLEELKDKKDYLPENFN